MRAGIAESAFRPARGLRPRLTEAEAARHGYASVLGATGPAGAERSDPWDPASERMLTGDAVPALDAVVRPGPPGAVQAAIDAAIESRRAAGRADRVVIGLAPGLHQGPVLLSADQGAGPAVPVTLIGLDPDPARTEIAAAIDACMTGPEYRHRFGSRFRGAPPGTAALFERIAARETIGTAQSAVLRIETDDFQARGLTVRNTYNANRPAAAPPGVSPNARGQYPEGQHQAVALHVAGADRVHLERLRLLGHQDTLYLQSPAPRSTARTFLRDCLIEGDVDFIFGQATGFFRNCTIRSLGARGAHAWATAPSTNLHSRHGFVFERCAFTHDDSPASRAGLFHLGRQWFEGVRATPYGEGAPPGYHCDFGAVSSYSPPFGTISRDTLEAVGKCVLIECRIGAHVNRAAPWDSWNGGRFSPDGRFHPVGWNARLRPIQASARDFLDLLRRWPPAADLDLAVIDPGEIFLGEYRSVEPGTGMRQS